MQNQQQIFLNELQQEVMDSQQKIMRDQFTSLNKKRGMLLEE